jgi:hypothetical protein
VKEGKGTVDLPLELIKSVLGLPLSFDLSSPRPRSFILPSGITLGFALTGKAGGTSQSTSPVSSSSVSVSMSNIQTPDRDSDSDSGIDLLLELSNNRHSRRKSSERDSSEGEGASRQAKKVKR